MLNRLLAVACAGCLAFSLNTAWAAPPADVVSTIHSFDPTKGEFPEGLAVDKRNNVYVGLFFLGEIWKFAPNGTPSLFATLDNGQFGGAIVGLAVDDDGNVYVCNASNVAGTHGIWKVDHLGRATLFAALDPLSHPEAVPLTPFPPVGSPALEYGFPNGLTFDEQGNLFVTDSFLALIWKITKSGEVTVWVQDPLLDYNLLVGNIGANGVEFDRSSMFVTNTAQGSVVRVPIPQKDQRPKAEVFVQDPTLLGADGLAFDIHHNMYVAIDFQNTLVRIAPDATITTLATQSEGLDYPASTSFGESRGERTHLYFTNAGVIFGTPTLKKIDIDIPGVRLP